MSIALAASQPQSKSAVATSSSDLPVMSITFEMKVRRLYTTCAMMFQTWLILAFLCGSMVLSWLWVICASRSCSEVGTWANESVQKCPHNLGRDEVENDVTHKLGLLLLCVLLHNRSRWSFLLLFPAGLLVVVLMFDARHLRFKSQ